LGSINLEDLEKKIIDRKMLAGIMAKDPNTIPEVLEGLSSSRPSIRYGCAAALTKLSETCPENLYQYMDSFIDLLDSKYRILTWNAMAIIANLAGVDKDKRFDKIFDKYYGFLKNEYLVTVANVAANSAKIGLAKPYLTSRITTRLLEVEKTPLTPHLSEECRRVIIEKTLETFAELLNQIEEKEKVTSFTKRQLESPRASLQNKAKTLLENITRTEKHTPKHARKKQNHAIHNVEDKDNLVV
jgi:hypothetical protein